MLRVGEPVPEWRVRRWIRGPEHSLASLRGKVVIVHTFQMLCPGCIYRGVPQASRLSAQLNADDAVVIGLHTVFEHHEAMGDASLEAFLSELRVPFPVGVDAHEEPRGRPWTMRTWDLPGTLCTVLIDRRGHLAHLGFGVEEDLALGLRIGALIAAPRSEEVESPTEGCGAQTCSAD